MDGWESRRRRLPGNDWCIIKLGLPGHVLGVEIDTAFFTGNQVTVTVTGQQASMMLASWARARSG